MKTTILIEFEGLTSDEGHLELYEASEALNGLASSVNLVTHGFVHDNEVRTKVPVQKDFKTYFSSAKKGCFDLSIDVLFEPKTIKKHGKSVIFDRYWDYLSYTIANSIGENYTPQTPYLENILEDKPYHFDDLAEELESHLARVHRPIKTKNAITTKFIRPRVGEKIVLNKTTLAYVSASIVSNIEEAWSGNITKYNILSGKGRAFINEIGRTVPFFIKDFENHGLPVHHAASESMDEGARLGAKVGGKRLFTGFKTTSNRDIVKRIQITGIQKTQL